MSNEYDMLVKLYELPDYHCPDEHFLSSGIRIIRPMPADQSSIAQWIRQNFGEVWANEFHKSMSNQPCSCYIAIDAQKQILGFACYDAVCRDFFGPIGVSEDHRREHIGQELLLRCLYAMREEGYAYAIIGWVHDDNRPFYHSVCGALPIPDSFPGFFDHSLSLHR